MEARLCNYSAKLCGLGIMMCMGFASDLLRICIGFASDLRPVRRICFLSCVFFPWENDETHGIHFPPLSPFTKGLPLSVLHKASCYTGRLMLLGCFLLQAAAKAKATMSASLMRRWATVQKTKLNSACNAATQVNAALPLLDLACGKMGSFFPPLEAF